MLFRSGFTFIIMRAIGKYGGVFLAAWGIGMEKKIRNYLGLSLLPQAGVAIGLVLFVQASPIMADLSPAVHLEISKMINIVLMSVFFNEIIGPPLSKIAIVKNLKRR